MGSKYSSQSVSGYNATPPADDGTVSEANKVKWSTIKTKLSDPLNTFASAVNSALTTFFNIGPTALTTNTTLGLTHHNTFIQASGSSVTLTLSDAATLGAGWFCTIRNVDSSNTITLARATGGDTIDGAAASVTLYPSDNFMVYVNAAGSGFFTKGFLASAAVKFAGNVNLAADVDVGGSELLAGSVIAANAAGTGVVGWAPRGYCSGLTFANNAGDATNDLDIAVGEAADSTNVVIMKLTSAITKQSDVAWAVGSGNGGLDTGAVGNSDYYIWLIMRSDTGVVDVLYSLSSTAPTMPTNYDYKRVIGWFKRVGATIVACHTYELSGGGLELLWDSPTLDVNLANTLTTSQRTDAVKVPLNFSVVAGMNVNLTDASTGFRVYMHCPDATDVAVGDSTTAPCVTFQSTSGGVEAKGYIELRTSATGTIAARSTLATVDQYSISTTGFKWSRR